MLTFKQFVSEQHLSAMRKHDLTAAEAREELPKHIYWVEWRDYVVKSFNAGQEIPTKLWRSLDEGLQHRILRSPRALKSNEVTAALKAKLK